MKRAFLLFVTLIFLATMPIMAGTLDWTLTGPDNGIGNPTFTGSGTFTTVFSGTPGIWDITAMDGTFTDNVNGVGGYVGLAGNIGYGTSLDGLYTFDNRLSNYQLVNANNANGLLFAFGWIEANIAYGGIGVAPYTSQLWETIPGYPVYEPSNGPGYAIDFEITKSAPEPASLFMLATGLMVLGLLRRKRTAKA